MGRLIGSKNKARTVNSYRSKSPVKLKVTRTPGRTAGTEKVLSETTGTAHNAVRNKAQLATPVGVVNNSPAKKIVV